MRRTWLELLSRTRQEHQLFAVVLSLCGALMTWAVVPGLVTVDEANIVGRIRWFCREL